jgi:hypothetical protein
VLTVFTSRSTVTLAASAVALTLSTSCARPPAPPPQTQPIPTQAAEAEPAAAAPATPAVAPPANAPTAAAVPVKPRPQKVKIIVRSAPPKSLVFWGKKKLGETPVTLERPRDSGPVDLVVKSDGFFPLHTRAYTFRNDTIYAKLTKLEDRMSLFGAKHDATTQLPAAPPGADPANPVAPPAAPATPPQ